MTTQTEKSLARKVSNTLARGVVKLVDDEKSTQTLQVTLLADETRDDIEHAQQYGLTSHPLLDAECIAIFFGGNRDHGSILTTFDKRYRPKNLPKGSVCLYDASGTKILLKNNGEIEVTASGVVKITAEKVVVVGDVEVQGSIKATGDITDQSATTPKTMAQMRSAYNTHTHIDSSTNPTSGPNNPM